MARSNARAGPSQPSQTQRTRAGRVRIEDVVPEDQDDEENSDNEDEEEEEEEVAPMDVDDEAETVRYRPFGEKIFLNYWRDCRSSVVELTISYV